ncbi:hypothetical protein [Nannocystis bainbridge]|uniref:Uncharacterized protein n=1 Tax=Nannocystis bainbridge TaxID=2995303 RepID=A0ABT5EAB4_9BACT|nr:hypothetical protein [Nannocystis bainbridge]MDC0722801.1 hypothetical protein [Nannocystis bainbridge]
MRPTTREPESASIDTSTTAGPRPEAGSPRTQRLRLRTGIKAGDKTDSEQAGNEHSS